MKKKKLFAFYTVACDKCGDEAHEDWLEWHDLEIVLDSYGWETVGEKHYCEKCWEEMEGEK